MQIFAAQQANEAVERWGIDRFVRMLNSKKPNCAVKLAHMRTQLMPRVVGQRPL
jgi:hypothetical protein